MMSTPESQDPQRLTRILDRLIERTEADKVKWETGAPADSYAVNVADTRFRIRSRNGDGQAPYILDFGRKAISPIESDVAAQPDRNAQLQRLYEVAKRSAIANAPDPLRNVEQHLGLIEPSSGNG